MDKDATQETGVSKEAQEKTKPKLDTANFDFIESIADNNEKVLAADEATLAKNEGRKPAEWASEILEEKETKEKETETETEEKTEKETETETETEEKTEKETETETETEEKETEETDEKEEELEIIVDGVKKKVPISKIIDAGTRTLQKSEAADVRLEKATLLLKEAKKTVKKIDPVDDSSDDDIESLRSEYIQAIQYGTSDEATEALKNWEDAVISRAPKKATQQMTQDDVKKLIKATELETQINASPESGGFSDLLSNPVLREQTSALVDTLVKNGQGTYDSFETYKRAGEVIRTIGKTLDKDYTPPKVSITTDSFENKRKKKKQIDNLETASSKATSKKSSDKKETVSDVINEIRKSRGQ